MQQHRGEQISYDTEVVCTTCGERLYLTASGVVTVLDALKRTGVVGLQCVCGQVQLIGPDFKLLRRTTRSTHDAPPC
jgi:hypothetical protein